MKWYRSEMPSANRTMSVRLSQRAYDALRGLAAERSTSLNKTIEESIEAMAAVQRKERLRTAFSRLAEAEHSVEYAQEAQSEVVLASE